VTDTSSTNDDSREHQQRRHLGLGYVMFLVTLLMMGVEFCIMMLFHNVHPFAPWEMALFDSSLLSLIVGPITYWGVVRPRDLELRKLIAKLDQERKDAEKLASIDMLTGVQSRRAIYESLEREWKASERHSQAIACVMIDIDDFKILNDTHGHQVGDLVLVEVAGAIKKHLRATDHAGRYGGEEFLLVLPQTSLVGAHALAERMRTAISKIEIVHQHSPVRTSVSIGIAEKDRDTNQSSVLVGQADEALYQAKESGKNRVCGS